MPEYQPDFFETLNIIETQQVIDYLKGNNAALFTVSISPTLISSNQSEREELQNRLQSRLLKLTNHRNKAYESHISGNYVYAKKEYRKYFSLLQNDHQKDPDTWNDFQQCIKEIRSKKVQRIKFIAISLTFILIAIVSVEISCRWSLKRFNEAIQSKDRISAHRASIWIKWRYRNIESDIALIDKFYDTKNTVEKRIDSLKLHQPNLMLEQQNKILEIEANPSLVLSCRKLSEVEDYLSDQLNLLDKFNASKHILADCIANIRLIEYHDIFCGDEIKKIDYEYDVLKNTTNEDFEVKILELETLITEASKLSSLIRKRDQIHTQLGDRRRQLEEKYSNIIIYQTVATVAEADQELLDAYKIKMTKLNDHINTCKNLEEASVIPSEIEHILDELLILYTDNINVSISSAKKAFESSYNENYDQKLFEQYRPSKHEDLLNYINDAQQAYSNPQTLEFAEALYNESTKLINELHQLVQQKQNEKKEYQERLDTLNYKVAKLKDSVFVNITSPEFIKIDNRIKSSQNAADKFNYKIALNLIESAHLNTIKYEATIEELTLLKKEMNNLQSTIPKNIITIYPNFYEDFDKALRLADSVPIFEKKIYYDQAIVILNNCISDSLIVDVYKKEQEHLIPFLGSFTRTEQEKISLHTQLDVLLIEAEQPGSAGLDATIKSIEILKVGRKVLALDNLLNQIGNTILSNRKVNDSEANEFLRRLKIIMRGSENHLILTEIESKITTKINNARMKKLWPFS